MKRNINHFSPSCVIIQESKLRKCGSLKLKGYQIFELTRQGMGGGLFTAIDESLSPVLVSAGNNGNEILTVQVQVGGIKMRILNAYGPQEGSNKDDILDFWHEVENQIITAKEEECGIILELDANAKLGKDIISNDPNLMSFNGQIMNEIIIRQQLNIGNTSNLCNGTITRHRSTVEKEEKAVLDYLVFCERILPFFNVMLIDEARHHVLKRYVTTKGAVKHSESDHNTIYAKFSLNYTENKSEIKRVIFDFQNKEGLEQFTKITTESEQFRNCYNPNKSMADNSNKFFKTLDDTLHRCFTKIRIKSKSTKQVPCEIQEELNMVTMLKQCIESSNCKLGKEICISQLEKTEEKITSLMAERNLNLVNQQIAQISSTDGNFNQNNLWKVKSNLLPRPQDPPMAKRDAGGNLVTAPLPLKKLYIETYKKRLEHRPMKEEYKDIYELKTLLWDLRFREIKGLKSLP